MDLKQAEVVLCEFYFSDLKQNKPQAIKSDGKKTFVISKQVVIKKYGTLSTQSFRKLHLTFCRYFGCENPS